MSLPGKLAEVDLKEKILLFFVAVGDRRFILITLLISVFISLQAG